VLIYAKSTQCIIAKNSESENAEIISTAQLSSCWVVDAIVFVLSRRCDLTSNWVIKSLESECKTIPGMQIAKVRFGTMYVYIANSFEMRQIVEQLF